MDTIDVLLTGILCAFVVYISALIFSLEPAQDADCYDADLVIKVFEACQSDDACRDRLTMDDLLDYERAKREVEKCGS